MVTSECVQCDLSSNYLSGKECKAVETKVTNCASYKSATDCNACISGFQLQENVCNALPANCAYMGTDKKCLACNPKYLLKEGACTSITISNCAQVTSADETKCQTCVSGYYVKDGACASIGIDECVTGSENKCSTCSEGYLLKDDGTVCTSSKSCLAAVYGSSIQCVQCNVFKGYFATDVKGEATITYDGKQKWEQVCTSFSKMASVAIIAALTMTLF